MANDAVKDVLHAGGNPYAAPVADMSHDVPSDDDRAGSAERCAAFMIDLMIMYLVVFIPYGLLGHNAESYVLGTGYDPEKGVALMGILYGVALYLVVNGFTLARRGQTLGKLLMRIRIVRPDGSPAGFARLVLLRILPFSLALCLPFLNLLTWIEALFVFRESRQCLHDQLADTKVVKIRS